jgi:hypothetical protein
MTYEFLTYQINHLDSSNPISLIRHSYYGETSLNLMKNYNNYYKQVDYQTDYGNVFEDIKTTHGMQLEKRDVTVDMYNRNAPSPLFGRMYFIVSDVKDIYNRRYLKLQEVLANIGGMAKLVFMLSTIIVEFCTEKLFYVDLGSNFIDIEPEEKNKTNIVNIYRPTTDKNNSVVPIVANNKYLFILIF